MRTIYVGLLSLICNEKKAMGNGVEKHFLAQHTQN